MTRRRDVAAEDDEGLRVLADSFAPVCTLVGKASVLHVEKVVRVSREENLAMIADSVAFLVGAGKRVLFDAEHFFDGFALDPGYALDCLRAAADAGAERVVLCDTNGGSLPPQIRTALRRRARSAAGRRARHPHPRRLRLRRRQHAHGRRSGRHAGAGHDQRHRRAHRQRQPDHDHRRPAAEDGLRAARAGAPRAPDRDRALRRRAAQPLAQPGAAVRRQARLRAQGRHARGGRARRRADLRAHRPRGRRQPSRRADLRALGQGHDRREGAPKPASSSRPARLARRSPSGSSSASRSSSTRASSSRPPTAPSSC